VEILWVQAKCLTLRDLAELEPAENITDVTLLWVEGLNIKQVFTVLRRSRHLNRLTLKSRADATLAVPPLNVLGDFVIEMKHLSQLHIIPPFNDRSIDGQLEILRDKVNELILPRRPNFKFDISG
jgi:hypothetical protein